MNAPLALFVYNRPRHTRQTVEALLRNERASESDLIVFSDAERGPESAAAVQEVPSRRLRPGLGPGARDH